MLEEEKSCLETEMSSGVLSTDELIEKSNRIAVLIDLIDEKTMRWLELSEMQQIKNGWISKYVFYL